jgi:hypothetical protein
MQPNGRNGPGISLRTSVNFSPPASHFVPDAPLLVSCIRCRRLHSAGRPFEFNPVCAACAGHLARLDA